MGDSSGEQYHKILPVSIATPSILRTILFFADRETLSTSLQVSWSFFEIGSPFLYKNYKLNPDDWDRPFALFDDTSALRQSLLRQIKVLDLIWHDEGCAVHEDGPPIEFPNLVCLRLHLWPFRPRTFCRAWYLESRCCLVTGTHTKLVIRGLKSLCDTKLNGVDTYKSLSPTTKKLIIRMEAGQFRSLFARNTTKLPNVKEVVIVLDPDDGSTARGSWWTAPYTSRHMRDISQHTRASAKHFHEVGRNLVDLMIENPDIDFTLCNGHFLDYFGDITWEDGTVTQGWTSVETAIDIRFAEVLRLAEMDSRTPRLTYMPFQRYLKERDWEYEFDEEDVVPWLPGGTYVQNANYNR